MSFTNINIIGSAIYHPKNKVNNEYYIEHFKKLDIPVEGLLNHLCRENRYIIDNKDQNVITMGVNASNKAIEDAGIDKDDIDIIVFISDTPEYTTPSNAVIIHNKLGLKANMAFDLNNNCIGMLTALDLISNYMKSNSDFTNALLVGGQNISFFAREDDPVTFATSGDASAAIVLQKKEEEEKRGLIDCVYYADTYLQHTMRFPGCGMSQVLNEEISFEDKRLIFKSHDVNYLSTGWKKIISKVIERNDLSIKDVEQYLFSQFSLVQIEQVLEELEADPNKFTFIGDEFGYTGCTSPIFAYHFALNRNKIKSNDYIIFCSVGVGYTMNAILYKV